MLQPKIAIIILNWNGWEDTIECLESLYQITYENYTIFLIDNASTDDSISKIAEYCKGNIPIKSPFFTYSTQNKPVALFLSNRADLDDTKDLPAIFEGPLQKKVLLIKNEQNYGFAEANNIGIKCALAAQNPDYFLLLNNDTVVDGEFLTELVKVAESERSIGIAGPKTYYYSQPTKIQSAWNTINLLGGRINNKGAGQIDTGQFNVNKETGYVFGSCFLIKREALDRVGLLDGRFSSYWEDTDYCVRASRLNFKSFYCCKANIWHKISSSSRKTGLSDYYGIRNMFWFMKKHATKVQYVSFLLFFAAYRFWFMSAKYLVRQSNPKPFFCFLNGIRDGIEKDLSSNKNS